MFKQTVYKKVNRSRNFFLLILLVLLVLVGGKIILAHEKIATYQEAMRLFESGEFVAAEKKFRAAKRNLAVTDHNKDINQKLAILSPIREAIEDLAEKAADYDSKQDLDKLVDIYERWQESKTNWLSGTVVQKGMYEEMVALTKLDQNMKLYFSTIRKTNLAKLQNNTANRSSAEEAIFTSLNKIPSEYYGNEPSVKTKEIQTAFQSYYAGKIKAMTASNTPVADLVTEGSRQFEMLEKFSVDSNWLKGALDSHLLNVLTAALSKKDYPTFAEQANSTKRLTAHMAAAKVFPFIEKAKNELLTKAKTLTAGNKFADAISIYEALKPLENTDQLIASANQAWDKFEPIRALERLYPDKEFPNFVNTKNKWGAESVVAAASKDGGIYFGKLKGEEPMAVMEGSLQGSPAITLLAFQSNLSKSDNPVIYMEAKSSERKHRYLAYEVRSGSMVKILDIDADQLTVEAKNVLLIENPTGEGAGQPAYYELANDGEYHFSKIKVDYVDIKVDDIANYLGKKVRFTTFAAAKDNDGALVTLTESYNYSSRQWEKTYLLLKGKTNFTIYTNYTVIGTFNSYANITTDTGEQLRVPVFQVEKVE